MKISLRNLGELKKAEFELGDLTIICGGNNTGKTYATHALYGFLHTWVRELRYIVTFNSKNIKPLLSKKEIRILFEKGFIEIDIQILKKALEKLLDQICKEYTSNLPIRLAATPKYFKKSQFRMTDLDTTHLDEAIEENVALRSDEDIIKISKAKKARTLKIEMQNVPEITNRIKESRFGGIFYDHVVSKIYSALIKIIYKKDFLNAFIISPERTGASIFRNELDFARNRIVEELVAGGRDLNPFEVLTKSSSPYPLPVRDNVDFIRNLAEIQKKTSFIVVDHKDILEALEALVGGKYVVSKKSGGVSFVPHNTKVRLSMSESSSSVRSLLIFDAYLRHEVQKGGLLMIDEPELNLHPTKQRQMARLLARLVNIGIKVFITTHSDYIIREFNTLIMLDEKEPHLKKIMKKEGYEKSELITKKQIKAYFAYYPAKEGYYILKKAKLDEVGIDMKSFDKTLDDMNRIQGDIAWGW